MKIEKIGTAGVFDYTVLSATDAGELTRWLDEHGYEARPESQEIFQRYVQAGWYWLAMQVRSDEGAKPTLAPHPIVYTYPGTELVYPLAISRPSAAPRSEVVVYVLADKRFGCENWGNFTIARADLELSVASPSGTNYERLLEQQCHRGGGAFATEYAGDSHTLQLHGLVTRLGAGQSPPPMYLTRLRAALTPADMDRDLRLTPITGGDVGNAYYIHAPADARAAGGAALPFVTLAAMWAVTHIGKWRRRSTPEDGAVQ